MLSDPVFLTSQHERPWGFPIVQTVKSLTAKQETQVLSLGWEDSLEKGITTHSSMLVWRSRWTEGPGGLLRTTTLIAVPPASLCAHCAIVFLAVKCCHVGLGLSRASRYPGGKRTHPQSRSSVQRSQPLCSLSRLSVTLPGAFLNVFVKYPLDPLRELTQGRRGAVRECVDTRLYVINIPQHSSTLGSFHCSMYLAFRNIRFNISSSFLQSVTV